MDRKVAAGGLAGALTTVLVWAVQMIFEITVPAEVAAAVTTILSFFTAALTPSMRSK